MDDIFKLRKKPERYKNLKTISCVICGREFEVRAFSKNTLTCCTYCSQVKLILQKSKGHYVLCSICDKPIWTMKCRKPKRHFCSKDCADVGTQLFANERNIKRVPNREKKCDYGDNWSVQKRRARKRDNFTCRRCGVTEEEYGKRLSVHHKKPFVLFDNYKEANKLENLISVCEPCHRKFHSGEGHHTKYLL